jgi:hypothetical protein
MNTPTPSQENSSAAASPSISNSAGSPIDGISLRDYFAAAAIQGIIATNGALTNADVVAREAFRIADAMVKRSR